ncbi:MAG: peptidoglycan DD-metalloendopeptidase family protein [Anaerolineae bacterium]|nr:peptidoglycan DD-metalloendopeptidase family protein [Anaerolineae bacterium]
MTILVKLRYMLFVLLLAACQQPSATPFAATIPVSTNSVSVVATAVPTANPVSSRTPTLPPTATWTPSPTPTNTLTPTVTFTPSATFTPTNTLTPTTSPTPVPIASATPTDPANDPNATKAPTWTPPPADPGVQIADHYVFRRPISDDGVNYIARTYPYGGTAGGSLQVHLGVDMENPGGTPILAAGDGVVLYAGSDAGTQFGPSTSYYGNLVVIQHAVKSPDGQSVFTLYGHMQRVDVQTGQMVKQGDQLGQVGATGVAFGPHLHFEVRVGDAYNYRATRNPDLWIFPYRGFGTLVGKVVDSAGNLLYDATVQVKAVDANLIRYAFTYADTTVNSDPVFGENFTLGDLPANYYQVYVSENGRVRFQQIVYIYPNRSTWLTVQLN